MRRRYGGNREARMQYLEQRFRQHHVDIQRLWKRIPQGPHQFGVAQSSPADPIVFDPDMTGIASVGGPVNTGGTRHCSKGFTYHQQTRFPQRVRSTPFLRSNQVWETPMAAAGPTDGVGASCTMPPGAENRSRALVSDEYDFSIPIDAKILGLDADVVWKCERIVNLNAGSVIPFICEDRFGVESDANPLGPWFHRNGVRFGGTGHVIRQFATKAFQYDSGTQTYQHGFHTQFPHNGQIEDPNQFYAGVRATLTPEDINSSGFGWMLAFHGQTFGNGTFRVSIDSIAITVTYAVYHQTGCTGESI